jgi:hypothetical protein
MLRTTRNSQQGLFDWTLPLKNPENKRRLAGLENSWPRQFRTRIMPLIRESCAPLAPYFSPDNGRPTKDLATMVGLFVLQEARDLTDREAAEALAYNLAFRYALDIGKGDDDTLYVTVKTLYNYRRLIKENGLEKAIFNDNVALMVAEFGVDARRMRLDSAHFRTNMKRLGRLGVMSRTAAMLLKAVKGLEGGAELLGPVDKGLVERYLGKCGDEFACFADVRPSDRPRALLEAATDIYALLALFRPVPAVSALPEFALLERVFNDQCYLAPAPEGKIAVGAGAVIVSGGVSVVALRADDDDDAGPEPEPEPGRKAASAEAEAEAEGGHEGASVEVEAEGGHEAASVEVESEAGHEGASVEAEAEAGHEAASVEVEAEAEGGVSVRLRDNKDIKPSSMQNPSDPWAGWSGHKGEGGHVQVCETCIPGQLNLIVGVAVESADKPDSAALMPMLEALASRGLTPHKLLADTAYGGLQNRREAESKGVTLYSPVPGSKRERGRLMEEARAASFKAAGVADEVAGCGMAQAGVRLADFISDDGGLILACPMGQAAYNRMSPAGRGGRACFKRDICGVCPLRGLCPVTLGKGGAWLAYSRGQVLLDQARSFQETRHFWLEYRMRSGIEATNSQLARIGAKKLRVRGGGNASFKMHFKALALNAMRAAKWLGEAATPEKEKRLKAA